MKAQNHISIWVTAEKAGCQL